MKTFACAWLVLMAGSAFAQIELFDPDAPGVREKRGKKPPGLEAVDPAADEPTPAEDPEEPDPELKRPGAASQKPDAGGVVKDPKTGKALKPEPIAPVVQVKPSAPTIQTRVITDGDLELAWQVWRSANQNSRGDIDAEKVARTRLVALKDEIGASNMDTWAVGLMRAAEAHEAAGDSGGAVEIALTAAQLAPDLPATWVALGRIYFLGDPSEAGRYLSALRKALVAQATDVRFLRSALADLIATLLLGLTVTAIFYLLVLAIRRGAYALYDFHFLFPRVASRWQTSALAIVLLSLPLVFRLGLVPVLLTLFLALTLYLSLAERVVAVVLIALVGAVPAVLGVVVERLPFAGTRAEQLFLLDRGGTGLEPFAAELTRLSSEDKASFVELMALGRYDLRRGRFEIANKSFKKALTIIPNDPAARVNLGTAMVLGGDLENPRALFEEAGKAAPTLAEAPYNLGRLYQRRVAVFGDQSAGDADRAATSLYDARTRDPSFGRWSNVDGVPTSMLANLYFRSVPLAPALILQEAKAPEAARRVKSQVLQLLVGEVNETLALIYPGLLALLVLGLGSLARTIEAARACNKCGRPVSHRGDPDVSAGSLMCTQCVNVFAKKNVAAPSLKVRKQLEVARYQSRLERTGTVLGFVFAGMGHVFAGFPVRGAFYAFLFVSLLTAFVLRNGVLRAPFESLPPVVRLVPLGVLFLLLYLLTLRGLRKKLGAS